MAERERNPTSNRRPPSDKDEAFWRSFLEEGGDTWKGIGEESHLELTAVGDAVNVAARLASHAEAGEVLVSTDAAAGSDLDPGLERHAVELKGKELPTEVVSVRIGL